MDELDEAYRSRLEEVRAAILEGRAFLKGKRIVRLNNWTGFAIVETKQSGQIINRSAPVGKGLEALCTITIR